MGWLPPHSHYPISFGTVRYVGRCQAVIATSAAIAVDAVGIVQVDYEVLQAAVDAEKAKQPGAPVLSKICRAMCITPGQESR
jgi:carbon-monoxide dehydrogenase large subunit